jgi:hypothetical protein
MIKIFLLLAIMFNSLFGYWVSKNQYIKTLEKKWYLEKIIPEIGFPGKYHKEIVRIHLGKYLRESSLGLYSFGDKEEDIFYYLHKGERVLISKSKWKKAKRYKNGGRYIYVKYWGKLWQKKLYLIEGHPKSITEASLGDFNITFRAIESVYQKYKLKELKRYMSKEGKIIRHRIELANKLMNNDKFNTRMSLWNFKRNLSEAIKRKMPNPLRRASSAHNGYWYNKRYLKALDKDIKNIHLALKQNRWNIDISKYYKE